MVLSPCPCSTATRDRASGWAWLRALSHSDRSGSLKGWDHCICTAGTRKCCLPPEGSSSLLAQGHVRLGSPRRNGGPGLRATSTVCARARPPELRSEPGTWLELLGLSTDSHGSCPLRQRPVRMTDPSSRRGGRVSPGRGPTCWSEQAVVVSSWGTFRPGWAL